MIALRVAFCRHNTAMHLASDYIHPYKDAGGRPARCRVRIYLPDDMHIEPVVICSELPNNPRGLNHQLCGGDSCGSDPGQRATHPAGVDRSLARGDYTRTGELRTGRLLQLRGYGEGALPGGDEGMDRRRYVETPRPRHGGGDGGREGVGV